MSVATTTAIAIGVGAAAAGSVASSAIGAHAAESAAGKQEKSAQNALQFQEQEYQQQQQNEKPFLMAGTQGVNSLAQLLSTPGEGLLSAYPGGEFSAPTLAQAEQTPGFEFQLEQGTQAIDQNAAANGSLLSGNTGKALTDYGQGLAQTDYNNLYQQAINTFLTNYGVWNTGQQNDYNRLAGLAGIGENAAANAGAQGQAAATNTGNLNIAEGQAAASGTVGAANAVTGGINSLTGLASQLPLLSLLQQQQQAQNASSYITPAAANSYVPPPNAGVNYTY